MLREQNEKFEVKPSNIDDMASAPPSLRGDKKVWKNFLGGPGKNSKIRGGAKFLGWPDQNRNRINNVYAL